MGEEMKGREEKGKNGGRQEQKKGKMRKKQ